MLTFPTLDHSVSGLLNQFLNSSRLEDVRYEAAELTAPSGRSAAFR